VIVAENEPPPPKRGGGGNLNLNIGGEREELSGSEFLPTKKNGHDLFLSV
jgi:hypothetical protein